MKTRELTLMALLVALGTTTARFAWFSVGVAKATPVQHAINVMAAVFLGPERAVLVAFLIGLLRNLLGVGSLLAFPGGMVGALLAGLCYRLTGRTWTAAVGELVGTGILGALLAYPVAKYFLGSSGAATMFVFPFIVSSGVGAVVGFALVSALLATGRLPGLQVQKRDS
ncbi:MAG: energy coupling factor transporter S component ThiW [Firmicutes bacterium]|jgi:energy coupling factor transporter S component ThiW|nr:energy coupling factor transporter S component ThiW [Bacillota bacterium]